ncbi:hypothetical protein GGP50_001641 [Salinibacter ruber]|nr:hypothetical protein [Salinibacter ruber]
MIDPAVQLRQPRKIEGLRNSPATHDGDIIHSPSS